MPDNENVSAAELQECLKGVDYPADRNELIEAAKDNEAPQNVMVFLERIPDKEYETPVDVSKELGNANDNMAA
jgi:hypothetical protein